MTVYGQYALNFKEKLKFLAVAEPIKARREQFASLHNIPVEMCFKSWEEVLNKDKLADVAFICTQDQMHIQPAIKALEKGYNVLLEKPMAHTLEGCLKIVKKVEDSNQILGIAHVLRYTNFFSTIFNTIQEGLLGDLINISHRENVSWYHMAHSFVRGNWKNSETSSPMILAKCCHDLDLLYWLVGNKPKIISSFGSLKHFRKENMPKGAPNYCVKGCPIEDSCLYYAPRIYIDIEPILQEIKYSNNKFLKFLANLRKNHKKTLTRLSSLIPILKRLRYWREWPVEPLYSGQPEEIEEDYSDLAKINLLRRSPYGKCVYNCDNNVVDHQVVNIEFENGVTANLTMHGFSEREGRTLRIDGTKATLMGEFRDSGQKIVLYDHFNGTEKIIFSQDLTMDASGHGGGDFLLIDAFLEALLNPAKIEPLTNAQETLESHLMAFAAEKSRLEGKTINMMEFREKSEGLL